MKRGGEAYDDEEVSTESERSYHSGINLETMEIFSKKGRLAVFRQKSIQTCT